jgi:hypothetical protein
MIIVWHGLGILVPIIIILTLSLCDVGFDLVLGSGYSHSHIWIRGIGFLACAPVCWTFGRYLRDRTGRSHAFFFIPMHWWGVIVAIPGMFCCMDGLVEEAQRVPPTQTARAAVPVKSPVTPPRNPNELKLQGIYYNPKKPGATINGKFVLVGDKINAHEVVAIKEALVIVASADGSRQVLTLSHDVR